MTKLTSVIEEHLRTKIPAGLDNYMHDQYKHALNQETLPSEFID